MALWTPAEIATALWLDASDSGTITLDGSDLVEQWDDKSGNDNHVTQSNASYKPAVLTDELNGLDVLDLVNDYLQGTAIDEPAISIFCVGQADQAGSGSYCSVFFCQGNALNFTSSQGIRFDNYSGNRRLGTNAGFLSSSGSSTAWHVRGGIKEAGARSLWVDGTSIASDSQAGDITTSASTFTIGRFQNNSSGGVDSSSMDGKVAELIVIPEAVDATTRQLIEGYLAHKWGLEGNLPVDHPYKSAAPEIPAVVSVQGVFSIVSPLGTGAALDLLNQLWVPFGNQVLRMKMSDDFIHAIRVVLGDQAALNLLTGMGLEGRLALRWQLGTSAAGAEAIRNLISGDPAQAAQVLRLAIEENNRVFGNQNLLLALTDLAAQFPAISCGIYIDGRPIRHRILSASVDYSQDGIHNAITIISSDFDLYPLCDPDRLRGEQRIELQVGARVLYFLLEERSGDDRQFSIWGRSLSAREDTPHAAEIGYTQGTPATASSTSEDLLTSTVLDWEAPDWVISEEFEFHGPPLEGIRQIAGAIGAVVRSQDDGSITVRRRYPTRPVDLATTSPDLSYSSDTDVIEVGFRRIPGTGYNAVTVNGYSPEVFLPDLEVEEDSPIQGDDVHVRAYWAGQIPASPPVVYVTAGSVTKLSDGTGTITERVVFSGGVGELDYPPESVTSVSWVGASGGAVSWEAHVKTLGIPQTAPRLANVTYTTRFSRYRLHGHNVPELVFTMVISPSRDASVRVLMGSGDREALAINEPLLTDRASCVERGRAFLDDARYDAIEIDITAPYQDEAIDGAVISLDQDGLSLSGNALIIAAGIEIQGPRILNRLRVRQWAVS